MYDQAYSAMTLGKQLRRSDFDGVPRANVDAYRKLLISAAVASVKSQFKSINPIRRFHLRRKPTYGFRMLEDELVARKLTSNLRQFIPVSSLGRDLIVRSFIRILEEGTPYRVYRTDIRSFYESIASSELASIATEHAALGPLSKSILANAMNHFHSMGGTGVPRGLALSAVLAELVMHRFDKYISERSGVYFYARYVDDILIVTGGKEGETTFLGEVEALLPQGLEFNRDKTNTMSISEEVSKKDPEKTIGTIEYLGYKFSVFNPAAGGGAARALYRRVTVDIAPSKVQKLKLRVHRSVGDYLKTGDFELLRDRIRLLTSNFRIFDKNTGRAKLAGIYHGYPRLTTDATALRSLDHFLRDALLRGNGRLFALLKAKLTSSRRRDLLGFSFSKGYSTRRFVHLHPKRIGEIQRCWRND